MTRAQAQQAYGRVRDWEQARAIRRRERILVPYFGGCMCRMHNCRVNYERGIYESPVRGMSHAQLVKLARKFDYEQAQDWKTAARLQDAFALYF